MEEKLNNARLRKQHGHNYKDANQDRPRSRSRDRGKNKQNVNSSGECPIFDINEIPIIAKHKKSRLHDFADDDLSLDISSRSEQSEINRMINEFSQMDEHLGGNNSSRSMLDESINSMSFSVLKEKAKTAI